jgi:very-short-patch-repair endonuclease
MGLSNWPYQETGTRDFGLYPWRAFCMTNITPTKQALDLATALRERGVEVVIEPWDGHKHIDIRIPNTRINIEVNGLQHYTDPKQILADFKRAHYSDVENFSTFPVTNQLIENYLNKIADAITQIVKSNPRKL